MRLKYTFLVIVLLGGFATTGMTQTGAAKKSCSCGFNSINLAGVAAGAKNPGFTIQTVNGFRYKTWFAGAGIGLDGYEQLTYPIFLDIRKDLWIREKYAIPFVYADGGYSFMVDKTRDKLNSFQINKYTGGLYYDIGLGLRIPMKKNQAFLLSAGQSMKKMEVEEYQNLALVDMVCFSGACDGYKGTYRYRLNRLSLKLGFQF
jgi:hypothetical protein